jgi:hypothetical protein
MGQDVEIVASPANWPGGSQIKLRHRIRNIGTSSSRVTRIRPVRLRDRLPKGSAQRRFRAEV